MEKDKRPLLVRYVEILENDEMFKGKFKYNTFTQEYSFSNSPINDDVITSIRQAIAEEYNIDSKQICKDALFNVCKKHAFNPFIKAINEIIWDGEERVSEFFIKFLKCEDTELNKSMTTKWFYALIKRIYEPGCDFDNMLIIYDQTQGTGKTKIVQKLIQSLGFNYGYDQTISPDSTQKDNLIKLGKCAIIGVDEFATFMKKDPEQTKSFVSASIDIYRPPYASCAIEVPRHCVFYGNCNMPYFLKDYTGTFERRYWIMNANGERRDPSWWNKNMPDEYLRQVWAEAKYLYDHDKDFCYQSLSVKEIEELTEVQKGHKTFNNDDILLHEIETLLNSSYQYTEFKNYMTFSVFANRILDDEDVIVTEETEFFEENKLSRLPAVWLKKLLVERKHKIGSSQYLTQIMETFGWYRKVMKYNKKTTKCFTNEV